MRRVPPGPLRAALVWVLLELVAAAQVPAGPGTLLGSWARTAGAPVHAAAVAVARAAGDLAMGMTDLRRMVAEHRRMRLELERCRARETAMRAEVRMLRSALPLTAATREGGRRIVVVACRYRNLVRGLLEVAGGLRDGLRPDQPVVTGDGVLGRVWRVEGPTSWVEILTGPSSAVAVRTPDGAVHGLAEGRGGARLAVRYVPRTAQLLVGTRLVTSGADGVYPPGIPVGQVVSVREKAGAFLEVEAVPAVDVRNVETAAVLTGWVGRRPR